MKIVTKTTENRVTLFLPPEGPVREVLYLFANSGPEDGPGTHGVLSLDEDCAAYDRPTRTRRGQGAPGVRALADAAALWVYALGAFRAQLRAWGIPDAEAPHMCCGDMPQQVAEYVVNGALHGDVADLRRVVISGDVSLGYGVLTRAEREIVRKRWEQLRIERDHGHVGAATHGKMHLLLESGVPILGLDALVAASGRPG